MAEVERVKKAWTFDLSMIKGQWSFDSKQYIMFLLHLKLHCIEPLICSLKDLYQLTSTTVSNYGKKYKQGKEKTLLYYRRGLGEVTLFDPCSRATGPPFLCQKVNNYA